MRKAATVVLKIALFPVLCLVVAARMISWLLVSCSAWIFRILAAACFLVTILCWLMGIDEGPEIRRMVIGSLAIFLIPVIAEGLVTVLEFFSKMLTGFIFAR